MSHRYTAPWSVDEAYCSQACHSCGRSMSSARRVVFAMLASAVRRQRSGSDRANQSNVPPSSKLAYAGPRARSRLRRYRSAPRLHSARRRGTHAVRRALQLGKHFVEGPLGHLDARHGAGEWLHGAPIAGSGRGAPRRVAGGSPYPGAGAEGRAAERPPPAACPE